MNTTQTAINFAPILTDLLQLAGLILVGVAGWAIKKYVSSHLDAQASALLETAIQNGIKYAEAAGEKFFANGKVEVAVSNPAIAAAANYAITHAPDALTRLGVSEQQLAEKIVARLP